MPRPSSVRLARVGGVELAIDPRWPAAVILLSTLVAQSLLPVLDPAWMPATRWLTAVAVVLSGEVTVLVHELSHAVAAVSHGQHVRRITLLGLAADTDAANAVSPGAEAQIALVGPFANLVLSLAFWAGFLALSDRTTPVAFALAILALGNAVAGAANLLPLPGSDGWRALRALRWAWATA